MRTSGPFSVYTSSDSPCPYPRSRTLSRWVHVPVDVRVHLDNRVSPRPTCCANVDVLAGSMVERLDGLVLHGRIKAKDALGIQCALGNRVGSQPGCPRGHEQQGQSPGGKPQYYFSHQTLSPQPVFK